jgi:hypothetical protein
VLRIATRGTGLRNRPIQREQTCRARSASCRRIRARKSAWTAAHNLRWLSTLKMEHTAQQIAFQEYLHSITQATARIARLDQAGHARRAGAVEPQAVGAGAATLAYQHEQPSYIHYGWQPLAPSRSPSGNVETHP